MLNSDLKSLIYKAKATVSQVQSSCIESTHWSLAHPANSGLNRTVCNTLCSGSFVLCFEENMVRTWGARKRNTAISSTKVSCNFRANAVLLLFGKMAAINHRCFLLLEGIICKICPWLLKYFSQPFLFFDKECLELFFY